MDRTRVIAARASKAMVLAFILASPVEGSLARAADPPELSSATVHGLEGHRIKLAAPKGGATVLIFYSTECPISNSYSPTLKSLAESFPADKVKFLGVCVDPDLSDADVKSHARDFGLKFPLSRDKHGALARKLGVKVTPEAAVIDGQGRLRYHGRIDDQFAARQKRNANPAENDLKNALEALLSGKELKTDFVESVGCPLPEVAHSARPTYARDVAPIIQQNCQECHRPGQVGPFPLETYEQARKRASDIAAVVDDRTMPPWKANPHVGPKFRDVRTLSEPEIDTIITWVENDAPLGNPAEAPPAPKFSDEWELGTPDLVLDIGADYEVPSSGEDIYRCFVAPTGLTEDKYVSAVEFRAGNRSVVHHILAYVDVSGKARERDQSDPGPGYSCFGGPGDPIHGGLGGWAPGNRPSFLDEGVGRSLPAKSDVIIQVHYHTRGKAETDRSKIGIYFAKKPVKQVLHWSVVINPELVLPPGQSSIEIKAAWEVPVDVVLRNVSPHMHLLGRDMQISAKFPDGTVHDLIRIDDWDFNWQYTYHLETPMELPKGTVVYLVSHFDNSAANPRNPNHPPKEVRWGEATTDEMCIGFLGVTKAGQDLTRPGEKDDYMDILRKQQEQYREKYEKMRREAEARKGKSSSPSGK
jgi:mono/diheme cytochrome c family protein/thiol-disulfide isomerase/thioredoxin